MEGQARTDRVQVHSTAFYFSRKLKSLDLQLKMLCLPGIDLFDNSQAQSTSAGDAAAYQRRAASLDDVVVVSALRTAITKVVSRTRLKISHTYLYLRTVHSWWA